MRNGLARKYVFLRVRLPTLSFVGLGIVETYSSRADNHNGTQVAVTSKITAVGGFKQSLVVTLIIGNKFESNHGPSR